MEIINISGYTEEEKVQIALRHLLPKQVKEHGLNNDMVHISENTIRRVIREYTRESGVRNLERNIASLCRKAAKQIVAGKANKVKVTVQNLEQFLGKPKYRFGIAEKEDQVGVATGLAWTEVGGDTLAIEVTVYKGNGKLTLTGKLGDVMKESAQASYSYVRSRAAELGIKHDVFEKFDIHVHVPEGAIPKDGPSAGITMAVALASALTNRRVRYDVAMTGEITLRGRVLPIGGVKEKVLAAHRAGVKTVILPMDNRKDIEEIPNNVQRQLELVLVDHMDEVLKVALREAEFSPETAQVEPPPAVAYGNVVDVEGGSELPNENNLS
jgi:ATP-dependent Lon protease